MLNKRFAKVLPILTFLLASACLCQKLITKTAQEAIDIFANRPTVSLYTTANKEVSASWQHNIDLLYDLYKSQVIPEHLKKEQPVFTGDEFNLMQVFEFLDHISISPGYQINYSYFYQPSFSGYPILYACKSPFFGNPEESTNCQKGGLGYVIADGSELGYLQWLLLLEMGDQFYIYWHEDYFKDKLFVSTEEALTNILLEIEESFNDQQKAQAGLIDPEPRFLIDEETIKIRVVWFTKFGGFYETYYQINKDQPHTTNVLETNLLLEYDCGIMY